MSWYDDHLGTPPAEGQGYRQDSRGSPRRPRDDYYYDEHCDDTGNSFGTDFVESDDDNSKARGSARSRSDGGMDDDDGARLGGDGGSHEWGSEETSDVGRDDGRHVDAVVLRSLEEAISKYSATRRRPSTAVSDLVGDPTEYGCV